MKIIASIRDLHRGGDRNMRSLGNLGLQARVVGLVPAINHWYSHQWLTNVGTSERKRFNIKEINYLNLAWYKILILRLMSYSENVSLCLNHFRHVHWINMDQVSINHFWFICLSLYKKQQKNQIIQQAYILQIYFKYKVKMNTNIYLIFKIESIFLQCKTPRFHTYYFFFFK